jgi:hypothetical protein
MIYGEGGISILGNPIAEGLGWETSCQLSWIECLGSVNENRSNCPIAFRANWIGVDVCPLVLRNGAKGDATVRNN